MQTLRLALATALLGCALPALAGVSWGGNLGLTYSRNDSWSTAGEHLGRNDTWFTGNLHLDAAFFTPGTLDLGASATYLGYRAEGGSKSDSLNYELRLNALARTPVNVAASWGGSTTEFTQDKSTTRTGTTRVEARSANVIALFPGTPYLSATIRQVDTSNQPAGSTAIHTEVTHLSAEASQSVDSLNYSLNYDTGWSSGDYAETNYRGYAAGLRTQAQLATNLTAQISANYNLRQPTNSSPLNPRMDNQSVSAWTQWTASADVSGGGGYSYSNSLFAAPGAEARQAVAHGLNAYVSQRLDADWSYDVSATFSDSTSRLGATEVKANGEQVGAGVRWGRTLAEYSLVASLAGFGGLFQPDGSPSTSAWGVSGSVNGSRAIESWYASLGLSASHDENSDANAGSRSRLLGTLSAAGTPFGWSFSSLMTAGFSKSTSSYGTTQASNLRLDMTASRGGYTVNANAGITDDLSEVLSPAVPPATVPVPVDFNTKTNYIMAVVTIPTPWNLYTGLVGRYLSIAAPGRETSWETALSVTLGYSIGAFSLAAYDQISTGGFNGFATGRQNLFYVSLTRSFGR